MKIFKGLISFALLLNIATVLAFEAFIVNDIRIAGLQEFQREVFSIPYQFLWEIKSMTERL